MITRLKPAVIFAVIGIAIAVVIAGIDSYRHRFIRSDNDMLELLPHDNEAIFFANVKALRRNGLLGFVSGSKPVSDSGYQDFVQQTHFRYAGDLDALAGAANSNELFLVLRGRFDWPALRAYASKQGGSCSGAECRVPTSHAGRWASFLTIQPNVMALAISANGSAVEALRPRARHNTEQMPTEPIWLSLSPRLLRNPASFPEGLRIFAIMLQPANSIVLSAGRARVGFELKLYVICPSDATAETVRNQLEIQTKMMKIELMREGQKPNPADLSGLLTSGSFQAEKKQVIGIWAVPRELLKALE